MSYTVQTKALIDTSNGLAKAGEEYSNYAKNAVNKTAVPFMEWPIIGLGAKGSYDNAREIMYQAVGHSEQAVYAMHTALHTVALHYMQAESGSVIGDPAKAGLMNVPKDKPQPVGKNAPGAGFLAETGAAAGSLTAMALVAQLTVGLLAAATEPSGLGAFVSAVDAAIIITNVRNPFPWFGHRDSWNDVATAVGNGSSDIGNTLANFNKYWEGDAATAFGSYVKDTFQAKMASLAPLGTAMAGLCTNVAWAEITFAIGVIGATIPAVIAALIADAEAPETLGASLLQHLAIVGIWVGAIIAFITAAITMWNSVDSQGQTVLTAAHTAAQAFFNDARKLEGDAIAVDPTITAANNKWTDNDFKTHWKLKT